MFISIVFVVTAKYDKNLYIIDSSGNRNKKKNCDSTYKILIFFLNLTFEKAFKHLKIRFNQTQFASICKS